MANEGGRFQDVGLSWAQHSRLGGLRTVLAPGNDRITTRRNLFMHGVHSFGAKWTINHNRNVKRIVDFGCGSGRFTRVFGQHGWKVIGTEITPEMIETAKAEALPENATIHLTDGIAIPASDNSVDLIWCCAVLRYSLLIDNPVYDQIASEMFRVLKPGGRVVNVEMYVDNPPSEFTKDFESAGFTTVEIRVLHRYRHRLERYLLHRIVPSYLISTAGKLCAALRFRFDSANRSKPGLRDYFFVWEKPETNTPALKSCHDEDRN